MWKRIVCLSLALLTVLGLAACGAASASAAQPAPTSTPEPTPALSYEEQRALIESLRAVWDGADEFLDTWYYAFTDLDGNGRLEIVTASCQGTGLFTYARVWELNGDFSALIPCETTPEYPEGPDPWPDLIRDSLPCYTDPADGRRYYVCEDVTRDGAARYYNSLWSVSLHDGAFERTLLATEEIVYTDAINAYPTVTCADADGNPITEQEYETWPVRVFGRFARSDLPLDWTQVSFRWQEAGDGPMDVDAAAAYAGILDRYKTAYQTGNNTGEYAWGNDLSEIIAYSAHIGYALTDLDGDDVCELILAGVGTDDFSDGMLYDVYTLRGGEPSRVAVSQARDRWYLRTDSTLLNEGSSGAAFSNVFLYRFSGGLLVPTEGMITYFPGNEQDSCYYQTGSVSYEPRPEDQRITMEDYGARWDTWKSAVYVPPLIQLD